MIVSMLQHRSLRTQIAVVFGTLVAFLALVLSLAFSQLINRSIQRDASRSLQVVADNASTLLAQGLVDRSRQAEVLAAAETAWSQGLDSPEAQQLLARAQAFQPTSVWVGAADLQGVVRAAAGGLLLGQNVASRPWFQAGKEGLHVGDVHPAKLLQTLLPPTRSGDPHRLVDFAAPIRVGSETVGVLGIHGSWEWVREVMESLLPDRAAERGLQLYIFDQKGALIYAPDGQTEVPQAQGQSLPAGLRVDNNRDGSAPLVAVVPWHDGKRYLTAAVQLQAQNAASDLRWRIVAREPANTAFAEATRAVWLSLAIGALAALMTGSFAWRVAGRLSEDLYKLAAAASAVESSHGEIPLAKSSREARQLSTAMRSMTQRLLSANEAMEAKVRERTLELEEANHALDLLSRTDALTGLLNRRGFEAQMAFALALAHRSGRPLSLIAVDIDHFKRVNDTHGHDAGDGVLRRVARTMQARARSSDVVARLGGEEFVVLLPDTEVEGAVAIAQELVDMMASGGDPVVGQLTISAGVAVLRSADDTGAGLLQRADVALYEAKGQGRNRVCVEA